MHAAARPRRSSSAQLRLNGPLPNPALDALPVPDPAVTLTNGVQVEPDDGDEEEEEWCPTPEGVSDSGNADVTVKIRSPRDIQLHEVTVADAGANSTGERSGSIELGRTTPISSGRLVASPEPQQDLDVERAETPNSVPVVQITATPSTPQPSPPRPSVSAQSHSAEDTVRNLPSRSPSASLQEDPTHSRGNNSDTNVNRRASHRRSGIDSRAGNRFSGFFSNLLHLRDRDTMMPPSPSQLSRSSTPAPPSSPAPIKPPNRTSTPPPALPPPTLADLGLSISELTSHLAPSHYATPPTSGTFMQPNYLLLCHAQGLDVLPLSSPPTIQPYALVRRVPFKSVVVMEERGVLVAIAGRRDGVRVYALEDIRRAVEWRLDMEIRREAEKRRREENRLAITDLFSSEKRESKARAKAARANVKASSVPPVPPIPSVSSNPPVPPIPPVPHTQPSQPLDLPAPPAYSTPQPRLLPRTSIANFAIHAHARHRSSTVPAVVGRRAVNEGRDTQEKGEWMEDPDGDEEALVAAGPSGSAALDERTSASAAAAAAAAAAAEAASPISEITNTARISPRRSPSAPSLPSATSRRRRPSNLDLSGTLSTPVPAAAPSPAPTLMTIRRALSQTPQTTQAQVSDDEPTTPNGEVISFAEALLESRLPSAGPIGTTRPNVPTLLSTIASGDEDSRDSEPARRTTSRTAPSVGGSMRTERQQRRRWSVFDGIFQPSSSTPPVPAPPTNPSTSTSLTTLRPAASGSTPALVRRSSFPQVPPSPRVSHRSTQSHPLPQSSSTATLPTRSSHRFLPKILTAAFQLKRTQESSPRPAPTPPKTPVPERKTPTPTPPSNAPAPKLEYVKLPGTKGAIMVKAVETAKKSFLAILCGEAGEKVELFAGTYRTALGLSRTFILPDSPRSLELQLQGDDLVEVFLVFSQNVFGLEPATVRVREVRIGRAERRAARRRARDARSAEEAEPPAEADTTTVVTTAIVESTPGNATPPAEPDPLLEFERRPPPGPSRRASTGELASTPLEVPRAVPTPTPITPAPEDQALATAQMGPYTTFQQLSFAPCFPLASLADECMIPPTYLSFMKYRNEYEPDATPVVNNNSSPQAGPSTAPPPPPVPLLSPLQSALISWYYKDPKGVVQGPWKTSLMQSWFKNGFLPPHLPVRRDNETEYTLLRDLAAQSSDPTKPFLAVPPNMSSAASSSTTSLHDGPHLLKPISLLEQPKHFGPPALFFSSRGGHSTTIVDARGRAVLKGRFLWSNDDTSQPYLPTGRMGDVRRVEAFDVKKRAVIVAFRQGGLEAVDVGEALLGPGDESRNHLPHFTAPTSSVTRRNPFVWKIGSSLTSTPPTSPTSVTFSTTPSRKRGVSAGRFTGRPEVTTPSLDDMEYPDEELLFLGRNEDNVYFCEKNAGSFRILRLSTL